MGIFTPEAMVRAIRFAQIRSSSFRGARSANPESITTIVRMDFGFSPRGLPRNDEGNSIHPEKIPLADFHAAVAQDAVRGGGVEVEIGEGEIVEELLALQRQAGGADGERNFAAVGAFKLFGLECLQIVDGLGEPRPQLFKRLFSIG